MCEDGALFLKLELWVTDKVALEILRYKNFVVTKRLHLARR